MRQSQVGQHEAERKERVDAKILDVRGVDRALLAGLALQDREPSAKS